MVQKIARARIEKFYASRFSVSRIEENDRLAVAGLQCARFGLGPLADAPFYFVTCDFGAPILAKILSRAASYSQAANLGELSRILKERGSNADPRLIGSLYAFTVALEPLYEKLFMEGGRARADEVRETLYFKSGREVRLSELFKKDAAVCLEISALAQCHLQNEGFESVFFSGAIHWGEKALFNQDGTLHSFNVIGRGKSQLIFNPSSPGALPNGEFAPSIYCLAPICGQENDFFAEMRKGGKRFIRAKNVLGGDARDAFFGVSRSSE